MRKIKLSKGDWALVDDEDYAELSKYKWYLNGSGYAVTSRYLGQYKQVTVLMHRLITSCPKGLEIDHKDGNRLNNQKSNLRICTRGDNVRNQHIRWGECASKGVSRSGNNFRARIRANNKLVHLGSFQTELEAAQAYDRAALELHGEFANINFK